MASDKMDVTEWLRQPHCQKSNHFVQAPPIPLMLGEHPLLLSKTSDGSSVVTNFRFCVCECRAFINVPLMMIGEITVMEAYKRLRIGCKDGASYVCTFATPEDCRQCTELLKERTRIPRQAVDIFAYRFHFHAKMKEQDYPNLTSAEKEQVELIQPLPDETAYSFGKEVERLGFDCSKLKIWKMSQANENFEFCQTYPKYHILPATVDNDKLKYSTDFRAGKRFPSVVWRDKSSGVVLIRSSQPLPSFFGLTYYSNEADVFLLDEIVKACNKEQKMLSESNNFETNSDGKTPDGEGQGQELGGKVDNSQQSPPTSAKEVQVSKASQGSPSSARGALMVNGHVDCNGASPHVEPEEPNNQLAIVDCRSLAMVWGNSLKGGGTEDEALYKCNIIHLDLANIHTVRDSFFKLRNICHSYQDGSYYKALSGCMWLNYISSLLKGANTVVKLIHVDKRPVLVHCSDGWDRTAQIVSLSELMMDSYYRTIEGFQVLVAREWLAFGHKFAERGGHDPNCSDQNQQSPVFLQFLDCVYQLTLQYPASFQFNEAYLVKLLKHSQACLFGNFLHNSEKDRERCLNETASVWSLLKADNPQFLNLLYRDTSQVLTARCGEHEVVLWTSVYMAGQSPSPHGSPKDFCVALASTDETEEENSGNEGLSRSRSMDDVSKANVDCGRRNSDPNLAQTPESVTAGPSAPIHDTSSSSAELLHFPDSPPSNGFQSDDSPSSTADSPQATQSADSDRSCLVNGCETKSSPICSKSANAAPINRTPSKNGMYISTSNGHMSALDGAIVSLQDVVTNGSVEREHSMLCNENSTPVLEINTIASAKDGVAYLQCKTCDTNNGVDSGYFHSVGSTYSSSSHSSSYKSVPEERQTSLLSERLANCSETDPQVNGVSSQASFHSVSRSPDLDSASPEERKILALKQTQQALIQKIPMPPDVSKSVGGGDLRSSNSQRETNGHATMNDEDISVGLNSKSTDTLVGESEETGNLHSLGQNIYVTNALDVNVNFEQPIVTTTVGSLSSSGSSNRLRTGSPNAGATATPPRRGRTGSGASIDSSLSPCVCRGHWSDTGRLRHPSGGDASVRRWIGSSVSTSTTDISDSYIGKVSPPATERQAGVRQLLDVDGLTLFSDQRHDLLIDLVTEKDNKISSLEARLMQAIETIRASRTSQLSQQQAATMEELLLTDTEGGEFSSLGAHSNPASDASWEQLDESEEKIALWMPDEAVTHCAACDKTFWFARRKHHCRNCGKIFCADCVSFMAPVAGIYQKEPQRVCGRCHSRLMQLSPGASCDGRIPTMVADG